MKKTSSMISAKDFNDSLLSSERGSINYCELQPRIAKLGQKETSIQVPLTLQPIGVQKNLKVPRNHTKYSDLF